jgi:hypothetical protein
MGDTTPFKGKRETQQIPMTVLHRFTKPGGHWAEIRERTITTFRAIEFIVYVDGSLLESQMFHHGREAEYPAALATRSAQFVDGGWVKDSQPTPGGTQ